MFDYELKSNKKLLEENILEINKFNAWSRKKQIQESVISLGLAGLIGAHLLKNYVTKRSDMNKAYQETADQYVQQHGTVPTGVAYDAMLKKAREEGKARYAERKYGRRDEFFGKVMSALRPPPQALKANKTGDNIRYADIEGLHPSELAQGMGRGTLRSRVKKFVKDKLDPTHPTLSRLARTLGPVVADVLYKTAAEAKTSMAGSRPRKNPITGSIRHPYRYSPGISPASSFADKMADRNARRARMGLKPLVYPE